MMVRVRRAAALLAGRRERSILPVLMVAQDLYVRTVYRKLWREAGL